MASQKVSSSFAMAFGKMSGVEEAKQAEASMNNIQVPIGWSGRCQVTDMIADVSKAKADGKGQNPYVNFEMTVVDDEKYNGKKITKNYSFYESSTEKGVTSAATRYEWFLNDMEFAGMPRDLRVSHDDPSDLIEWWLDPDQPRYVQVEVTKNGKYTNVSIRKPAEAVDDSSSMAPPTQEKTEKPKAGMVKYLNKEWEVVQDDGGEEITIKSPSTGKERKVLRTDVTF